MNGSGKSARKTGFWKVAPDETAAVDVSTADGRVVISLAGAVVLVVVGPVKVDDGIAVPAVWLCWPQAATRAIESSQTMVRRKATEVHVR